MYSLENKPLDNPSKSTVQMKLRAALARRPWYLTVITVIIALSLATTIKVRIQTLVRTGGAHKPIKVYSFKDTAAHNGVKLFIALD